MGANYSRTSVIWTPAGRTKSVHNSEVSTLVKLGVAMDHRWWGVHRVGFYCTTSTSIDCSIILQMPRLHYNISTNILVTKLMNRMYMYLKYLSNEEA